MRLTILPYQIYLAKMACQLISLELIIGISTQIQNQIIKGQKSLTIKPGASIEGKRKKPLFGYQQPRHSTFYWLLRMGCWGIGGGN